MFYEIAKKVCHFLITILFSVRFEGLENIPQNGGFILCSNHRSNFDPIFIAVKLKRRLKFMAKAELFKNPAVSFVIKALGAFPVERGSGDSSAIDKSIGLLKAGNALVIFPEGTRSKDGKPLRPKSGAVVVASKSGADVLPVAVCFKGRLHFRTRVTIRYGSLIPNEEFAIRENRPGEIKEATGKVFGEVLKLIPEEMREI